MPKQDISKELLLASLSTYYENDQNIKILQKCINGDEKSKLSLRLIDWYVTNYCKKHNIVYNLKNQIEYFNVYMNYRSQLKAFKKVQFDPFRRREKIHFFYDSNKSLYTTIGQLNFFRWAIENKVLLNLEKNIQNVEYDMLSSQRNVKETQNILSKVVPKSSIKNMTTYSGNTLLSFS